MRHVVVDSTTFHPFGARRPAALESLFAAGTRREHRLYVPEVVVLEVTRHFGRRVNPAYNQFKDGLRVARDAGTLPPELDVAFKRPVKAALVRAFEQQLLSDVRAARGEVLPVPDVDHAWVLSRIFGPLKPSKDEEDSYRDALIWKSVVALAKRVEQPVVFITSNFTDFAAKGSSELHEHLKSDLIAEGLPEDAIVLFRGPADYHDEFLAAGEELRNLMQTLIDDEGGPRDSLRMLLANGLDGDRLGDVSISFDVEADIDELYVEAVNGIERIELDDVYDLGDDQYGLSLVVAVNLDVFYAVNHPTGRDVEMSPRWGIDGIEAGAPFLMNTEQKDLSLNVEVVWSAREEVWAEDIQVGYGSEIEDERTR